MAVLRSIPAPALNATTDWLGDQAALNTNATGFTAYPAGFYNAALNHYESLGTQTDKNWDRKQEVWKSQGNSFQQKLNKAYLKIAKDYDIPTIDASGTIEKIFDTIKHHLDI